MDPTPEWKSASKTPRKKHAKKAAVRNPLPLHKNQATHDQSQSGKM
jgi:hypothetical protein